MSAERDRKCDCCGAGRGSKKRRTQPKGIRYGRQNFDDAWDSSRPYILCASCYRDMLRDAPPPKDLFSLLVNAACEAGAQTDENAPPTHQKNTPSTRPRSGSSDSILSDISNTAAELALTPASITPMKRKQTRNAWKLAEKLFYAENPQVAEADNISPQNVRRWKQQAIAIKKAKKEKKIGLTTRARLDGAGRRQVFYEMSELQTIIITRFSLIRIAGIPMWSKYLLKELLIIVRARAPLLIEQFKFSRNWFDRWLRQQGHWTRRIGSTEKKLPADWIEQGIKMNQRIAFYVYTYDIHPRLVVNSDQTSIQFLPTGRSATWCAKTDSSVPIIGKNTISGIGIVYGMDCTGDSLPIQVSFKGKAKTTIPSGDVVNTCKAAGWSLVANEVSHWTALDAMCAYVEQILIPHYNRVIAEEQLPEERRHMVFLIDHWSVHYYKLRPWIEEKYKFIHLVFMPANCTAKLQPCDVIANQPLKRCFRDQCVSWMMDEVLPQINANVPTADYYIKTTATHMKPLALKWLYAAWLERKNHREYMKSGWRRVGTLDVWNADTATRTAVMANKALCEYTYVRSNITRKTRNKLSISVNNLMPMRDCSAEVSAACDKIDAALKNLSDGTDVKKRRRSSSRNLLVIQ